MRNTEANSDSRRRLGVAFLGLIAFGVLAWLLRATYVVSCTLALALVLTVLVQPVFSALFAVNMALTTANGWVFAADELEGWLAAAGFVDTDISPLPPPMPHWLARARKPDRPT